MIYVLIQNNSSSLFRMTTPSIFHKMYKKYTSAREQDLDFQQKRNLKTVIILNLTLASTCQVKNLTVQQSFMADKTLTLILRFSYVKLKFSIKGSHIVLQNYDFQVSVVLLDCKKVQDHTVWAILQKQYFLLFLLFSGSDFKMLYLLI